MIFLRNIQFKMNTIVITVVSLAVATGATPLSGRIIGGDDASEGQFPHIVSLRYVHDWLGDIHMCGATIIDSQWLITAAHCVVGYEQENFYIKAGIINLEDEGTIYQVENIIAHKDYDYINITEDIALIRVLENIEFIPNKIQPLPLNLQPMSGGEEVIAGGWGSTKLGGPSAEKLQWLKGNVVDAEECKKEHRSYPVTEGMICITAGLGHGMCHGDSGSFLMCDGKLCGVVSWGIPCARGFPDVFTRVSYYGDWIKDQIHSYQ